MVGRTDVRDLRRIVEASRAAWPQDGIGADRHVNALRDAIESLITDLSSPPADDVREALIARLRRPVREAPDYATEARAPMVADTILSDPLFEVRLRGAVTDTEHDRDDMMICRKCGAGLTARDVVDGEKPCPGPRGTVTEPTAGIMHIAGGTSTACGLPRAQVTHITDGVRYADCVQCLRTVARS